jgi:hypothetical protein
MGRLGKSRKSLSTRCLIGVLLLPSALYAGLPTRTFDAASYGAIGDGITDDTAALNRAMRACSASAGTLLLHSGKTYLVKRINPTSQWPGGIQLQPGCSLSGYGATIYIDDDTNGIGTPVGWKEHVIVADVKAGDRSLTLDSTEGLVTGQAAYFCYNRISTNTAECSSYGFAKITSVTGNRISLDKKLTDAMRLTDTPPQNRWLAVPQIVQNISIRGLSFTANWTNGGSIEAAISIQFGRNLLFKDLRFDEPGAGAIVLQFVDGAEIQNVTVTSAALDGGAAAKGRCLAYSETSDVQTSRVTCSNFRHAALDIEAASRALCFDQIVLRDTDPSAAPNMGYFGSGDGSQFSVGTITIDGTGSINGQTRGTLVSSNGPVSAAFVKIRDNTINGIGMDYGSPLSAVQNLIVGLVPRGPRNHVSGSFADPITTITICHVDLTKASTCGLPSGLYRQFEVKSLTGANAYSLLRVDYGWGQEFQSEGKDFHSKVAANRMVDVSGSTAYWGQNYPDQAVSTANRILEIRPTPGASGTDTLTVRVNYWPVVPQH